MSTLLHSQPTPSSDDKRVLQAFRTNLSSSYPRIVPATPDRAWMDNTGTTGSGWANRCLPLRIANQHGWFLLNDADFEVVWGGRNTRDNLKVTYQGQKPTLASSMFGYGILTFVIPYVFRTPPGFNLWARGPANLWKDGIAPLDGITETDWLPYSFTMNWVCTRRLKTITFRKDEPICMIVPVRRDDMEAFSPEIRNLDSDPELETGFDAWHRARLEAVKTSGVVQGRQAVKQQGQYIRGEGHVGERAMGLQTRLNIKSFREMEPAKSVSEPETTTIAKKTFLQRLLHR